MIFNENRLLADNSHEISYLIFRKLGKMLQNLSSAAVVIGAIRVRGCNIYDNYMDYVFTVVKMTSVAATDREKYHNSA